MPRIATLPSNKGRGAGGAGERASTATPWRCTRCRRTSSSCYSLEVQNRGGGAQIGEAPGQMSAWEERSRRLGRRAPGSWRLGGGARRRAWEEERLGAPRRSAWSKTTMEIQIRACHILCENHHPVAPT